MTDAVGRSPDIMETLVENAIEEFGWAPRDVYQGVFDLLFIRHEHDEAVELADHFELAKFVVQFPHLNQSPLSHKLITVEPVFNHLEHDSWETGFKSAQIVGKVMGSSGLKEDKFLWSKYNSLYRVAGASGFTGHLFEEIVHRIFAHGWEDSALRSQPTPMVSDGKDPPTFSTVPSFTPASVSHFPQLSTSPTDAVTVDFRSKDLNVTLENNKYYKSKAANNPLFGSFIVHHDPNNAVTISVFQMTISQAHGGSNKGYENIRRIMGHIKVLLRGLKGYNTDVKVQYFLVCPDDEPRRWSMAADWYDKDLENNHRGDAFCVRVRVPGTSLFTPDFAT